MTDFMINYYLDAISLIEREKEVPYFLDHKVRFFASLLSLRDKSDILHCIIKSSKSSNCFRYFHKNKALKEIFVFLDSLSTIPQNKARSHNAFEHTLKVIDLVPLDLLFLKWAALLHDLGKKDSYLLYGNFRQHQKIGGDLAIYICEIYNISDKERICAIVNNHMRPLDYQRSPNWSNRAIESFIKKCGKEYVLDVIKFAFYDKQSENKNIKFLEPLFELEEKVKKLL